MAALRYSRGSLDGSVLGLGRDISRNALMQRPLRACPRVSPNGGRRRHQVLLTPAAPWDDRVTQLCVAGAGGSRITYDSPLKGVPLGLAKCRDLIAIKIGSPLLI